jgi:hypothetical protein
MKRTRNVSESEDSLQDDEEEPQENAEEEPQDEPQEAPQEVEEEAANKRYSTTLSLKHSRLLPAILEALTAGNYTKREEGRLGEYDTVLAPFNLSKKDKNANGRWYHALYNDKGALQKDLLPIAIAFGLDIKEQGKTKGKYKHRDVLRKMLMLETCL